jgi:hypothetical protein
MNLKQRLEAIKPAAETRIPAEARAIMHRGNRGSVQVRNRQSRRQSWPKGAHLRSRESALGPCQLGGAAGEGPSGRQLLPRSMVTVLQCGAGGSAAERRANHRTGRLAGRDLTSA